MSWTAFFFILLVAGCSGQGTKNKNKNKDKECPEPLVKLAKTAENLRAFEFANPVANGMRLSRCFGDGPPLCSPQDTQRVADRYCQGVGFEFAYFWRATTINSTDCSPKVGAIDGGICDNVEFGGLCQGFERILCAGAKVFEGLFEGAFGKVTLRQNGENSPLEFTFLVEGLPKGKLELGLHENPVGKKKCDGVGRELRCDGCNLSKRHGKVKGPKTMKSFNDTKLTIFGKKSLEGRSVALYTKSGKMVACASLEQRFKVELPDTLVFPVIPSEEEEKKEPEEKKAAAPVEDTSASQPETTEPASEPGPAPEPAAAAEAEPAAEAEAPTAQPAPVFPEVISRCPPGKVCQLRKCRTDCNNLQTCCLCNKWFFATGKCVEDSWVKISGPGDCDFDTDCPPGVVCIGVKRLRTFNGVGFDETCCECLRHNADGTCKAGSFRLAKGTGDCGFEVDTSSLGLGPVIPDSEGEEGV